MRKVAKLNPDPFVALAVPKRGPIQALSSSRLHPACEGSCGDLQFACAQASAKEAPQSIEGDPAQGEGQALGVVRVSMRRQAGVGTWLRLKVSVCTDVRLHCPMTCSHGAPSTWLARQLNFMFAVKNFWGCSGWHRQHCGAVGEFRGPEALLNYFQLQRFRALDSGHVQC